MELEDLRSRLKNAKLELEAQVKKTEFVQNKLESEQNIMKKWRMSSNFIDNLEAEMLSNGCTLNFYELPKDK